MLKQQANEFYKNKKYQEAVQMYSQAIELMPENATYYSNRAAAKISMKDYEGSLSDSRKCLTLDPKSIKSYLRTSKCLLNLGNLSEATYQLMTAESIIQENVELNDNLSTVHKEMNQIRTFEMFVQRCIEALKNEEYFEALSSIESGFMGLDNNLSFVPGKGDCFYLFRSL